MKHPLIRAMEKPERLVVGLMSGTSADGVDAALCRISGHGTETMVRQERFVFLPFDEAVRREILRLAAGEEPACAADFCRINFRLGQLYVDAVRLLCEECGVAPGAIDLIGSHGQTLWHIPVEEAYLGAQMRSTLQLGECSVLAEAFGCPVIGDFRVRDVAAGGLGAPLVPYSEFLIYRSECENVALQNIGGIGNVTYLPRGCALDDVSAFDTGPGNMLIDAVYARITNGAFRWDEGGRFAAEGTADERLLRELMDDEFICRKPPKTTGREYYGPRFVERMTARAGELGVGERDLMATVTAFTAESIAYAVRHWLAAVPDKLIVGGGGSKNETILRKLAQLLPECAVMTNEALGYSSDAKEAVAFAVLANEALFAGANNVPTATGAKHPVVMGKISL